MAKTYARLLKAHQITYPQYLTVVIPWEQDGLSIQKIASRLEIEGATTTPMVQRLE